MTPPTAFAWRPILPWAGFALTIGGAGMAVAVDLDAPIWLIGAIGLTPWLPLLAIAVVRTWRVADGWLAFYLALVMTQVGHVGEHVVQIVQLRVLGLDAGHAHGVFGALDIEWVHFVWNAWILLAVGLLLVGFRRNRWLWITLPLAVWHLGEHTLLIAIHLATGTAGDPGLLARGGVIGGGLPLARPDLHLLYNLAETLPLIIGFGWQWRQESGDRRATTGPEASPPTSSAGTQGEAVAGLFLLAEADDNVQSVGCGLAGSASNPASASRSGTIGPTGNWRTDGAVARYDQARAQGAPPRPSRRRPAAGHDRRPGRGVGLSGPADDGRG